MSYWLEQLEKAEREERDWRKKAAQVNDRYVDEREDELESKTRFNILWSNTETLRPALISSTPIPEVRQRYKKDDPIARFAAKILERGLEFSVDQYDFIRFGKTIGNDFLLPGRAQAWMRYIPTFEKKDERIPLKMVEDGGETRFVRPNGESVDEFDVDDEGAFATDQTEELIYEEVRAERVPWEWYRQEPADCWDNVNWVARGRPYSKDELIEEFGKKGAAVDVNKTREGRKTKSEALKGKAIVWEIWDKRTRKQIFIAEEHEKPLEKNDDPLGLENFFPCPEPIYAVEDNDTMVPTPEFCLWQDQADELDELSARIRRVTEAIKARGAYAGENKVELNEILTADDNTLIAVEDWISWAEKGGVEGMISWTPIDIFAKVLQLLEQQRAIKVQEIYELTGVSDIQRGATDPRETARAQQLKANLGSRRLLTKQQAIQGFFRDIYRLKAEIIAEQFDPQTLKLMVGLENENQYFDAAVQMIKNDALRAFNVDIETDSTIAPDEERERQGLAEAMQAVSSYLAAIGPLAQNGMIPMPVAMGLLQDYLRKFRFGRKLDDLLEEHKNSQPPADPAQQEAAAEQQAEQQKAQQEAQMEQQRLQAELQAEQQKMQLEMQKMMAQLQIDQREHQQEMQQDQQEHDQEMAQDREKHNLDLQIAEEMGAAQAEAARNVQRQQASSNQ